MGLGATLLVADLAVPDELLEVAHHVAPNVADRDLPVLGRAADHPDEPLRRSSVS